MLRTLRYPLQPTAVARFLSVALFLTSAAVSQAQTYDGAIRGSITDPHGALISDASITLTDEATHQIRTTTTDSAGAYAFNALKPSTYTLHIDAASFSAADRTHIALATQDFLTLDVQLSVGGAINVVQVSADAPLVDPSTASVSTDLDQRRLEDIPVLGRNPYITAKLSGVFVNTGNPQFIRFADQNGTSTTSVAGGPVAANLYIVDGVPITDTNNRPIVIPTIESIQDVKVQANTYDAQVGRTGGGVFNTLLRSGSTTIEGIKLWASPVTKINGAFGMPDEAQRDALYDTVPKGTDILITHGPPLGILDDRQGCAALRRAVIRVKPKLHCFGHVHSAYGTHPTKNTLFVNASILDEDGAPSRKPIRLNLQAR
jgi:hypothetical protein